ncbi:MAG: tetratricopeptide repeat protein [Opitutaceae bacterium]
MPADLLASGSELLEAARLRRKGRPLEALGRLEALLAREPSPEAYHQLGNLLKSLGRHREADLMLREAVRLAPKNAAAHLNLGVNCLEMNRPAEALKSFRAAVELEPDRAEARNVLGHALATQGRCSEASDELKRALALKPGYAAAHDNLGRVLKAQGHSEEALAEHRAALALKRDPRTGSNLLYTLNLVPGMDPGEVAAEHRRWAALHAAPGDWPAPTGSGRSGRLRIGYVSADFVQHAVPFFILPVLRAHDRNRFEVFCYSSAATGDAMTRHLRGIAEHWRDIARLGDEAAAELIRSDGIDVLVDLAGHTAGNRLLVFARRPAAVQVTWLGYPNTTGLRQMDYRIVDALTDPSGEADGWCSERLLRLPGPFMAYEPPAGAPPVGRAPLEANGFVTFGCFNNLAKVNDEVIRLWARILLETPGSRIQFKSRGLADPKTAARLRERFEAAGVPGGRIGCDGEMRSVADHLRQYDGIDAALDPFPYNGATTTCEALLMGVPVITLAGRVHASRVGASLLAAIGHPEWVANSPEEYRAKCGALGSDPKRLSELRAGLREGVLSSRLCDGPGFTRRFECAIEEAVAARLGPIDGGPGSSG